MGRDARVGAARPQIRRTGKRVQAFEIPFTHRGGPVLDEMKAYFERKYPGGAV